MKPYLALTCLGPLLAGCSTTYDVPRDPQAEAFLTAQEEMLGESADVQLVAGQTIRLDSIVLQHDKLVGHEIGIGSQVEVPLKEVYEIAVTSVGRGVGRGMLQGMAVLGGSALVLGIAAAATPQKGLVQFDAAAVGLLMGVGVMSGMLLGGAYGAVGFSKYRYTVEQWNEGDTQQSNRRRLWVSSFQDETPSRVCILYGGKLVWLPKSGITIEQDGERIKLTVPAWMLGVE